MQLRYKGQHRKLLFPSSHNVKATIALKIESQVIWDRLAKVYDHLDLDCIHEIWAVKGQYLASNLSQILPFIASWSITKLYLWSNKNPQIINQILHIKFANLQQIYLCWNRIESIANICQIDSPFLTEIDLRDNLICSISGLEKLHCEVLKKLSLSGNLINAGGMLEAFYPMKGLSHLNLNRNLRECWVGIFKCQDGRAMRSLRVKGGIMNWDSTVMRAIGVKKFVRIQTIEVNDHHRQL